MQYCVESDFVWESPSTPNVIDMEWTRCVHWRIAEIAANLIIRITDQNTPIKYENLSASSNIILGLRKKKIPTNI